MGWNDHMDDDDDVSNLPPEARGNAFDTDGPFDPDDRWLRSFVSTSARLLAVNSTCGNPTIFPMKCPVPDSRSIRPNTFPVLLVMSWFCTSGHPSLRSVDVYGMSPLPQSCGRYFIVDSLFPHSAPMPVSILGRVPSIGARLRRTAPGPSGVERR